MKHTFLQDKTKTIVRQNSTILDKYGQKLNKTTKFERAEYRCGRNEFFSLQLTMRPACCKMGTNIHKEETHYE